MITELRDFTSGVKLAFEAKLNDEVHAYETMSIKGLVYDEYKHDLIDIYKHVYEIEQILKDRLDLKTDK